MNIAFVKLDKIGRVQKFYRNLFKIIRVVNNTYYIPTINEKIKNKLISKLKADGVDYAITENEMDLNYSKLDGKYLLKCAIPEVVDYCFKIVNKNAELEEIYVIAENYTKENIKIIETLTEKVKVVNVVTTHLKQFQELEKRLERKDIYITVSSNKRKALKNAELIINLDCKNFNGFNVNKSSIIVNCNHEFSLNKDFEGVCIEKVNANIKKIMRIFSENENMNKEELFEAELLKTNEYDEARYILEKAKMQITGVVGKRGIINVGEFEKNFPCPLTKLSNGINIFR